MLFFEWQSEAVNDGTKDFEQLRDTVEAFSLVYELEKYVVDRASDVWSEVEKLSINPMEGGLEKISFARVFRIEQFKKLNLLAGHA